MNRMFNFQVVCCFNYIHSPVTITFIVSHRASQRFTLLAWGLIAKSNIFLTNILQLACYFTLLPSHVKSNRRTIVHLAHSQQDMASRLPLCKCSGLHERNHLSLHIFGAKRNTRKRMHYLQKQVDLQILVYFHSAAVFCCLEAQSVHELDSSMSWIWHLS